MVAIADIGLRERSFDKLGLMGLEILESPEFISEWNAFVENVGKNILPKLVGNPPFATTVRLPVPGCKPADDDDQVYYCVNELGFPMHYTIITGRDARTVTTELMDGQTILYNRIGWSGDGLWRSFGGARENCELGIIF